MALNSASVTSSGFIEPMQPLLRWIIGALSALALVSAPFFADRAMAKTEEPEFKLLAKDGDFELREYAPIVAAEVTVEGDRDQAVNQGFRILAGYIFGGNSGSAKIEMTAPVTQSKGDTIAMTAPVTQSGADGVWTIRFMMPKDYSIKTLPKPNDGRIRFVEVPARRVAVLRFSGFWSDANLANHRDELKSLLGAKHLKPKGEPAFAFYDPPWQPFFWRRNEILWDVEGH
jgi:SOUL heme-binding protein